MSRCRKRHLSTRRLLCKEDDAIPETPRDETPDTTVSEVEEEGEADFRPERKRSRSRTPYNPDDMATWTLKMFLAHCKKHKLDPTSKSLSAINRRIRNRESAAATRRNTRIKMDRLEEQVKTLEARLEHYDRLLTESTEKNDRLKRRLERSLATRGECVVKEEEEEEEEEGEGSPIVFAYGTPPSSSSQEDSPFEPLPPLFDGMLSKSED
jgi:hypothetical protein